MIDPTQLQPPAPTLAAPAGPPTMPVDQARFSPAPQPAPVVPPLPEPKPKPEKPGGSFEEQVSREYDRLLHIVAPGVAKELGALPDSHDLTKGDEGDVWSYRDPKIRPEMLPSIADHVAAGIAQQYEQSGQPLPDQDTLTRLVASQVTRIQTGGLRRELVSRSFPTPDAQVARARGFARRYGPKPDGRAASATPQEQPAQEGY